MASKGTVPDEKEAENGSKKMKILCMGLGRTGTLSLKRAMEQLGYRSYHGEEAVKRGDFPKLLQALEAKVNGKGKQWEKEDWRNFFEDYDCIVNDAISTFTHEIIAAFPDAKVILTNRDVDKWASSMRKTVFPIMSWPSWKYIQWADPTLAKPLLDYMALTRRHDGMRLDELWGDKPKDGFMRHYASVREVVPKERLLEYKIQDGWEPLCAFLGEKVPEEEFPNINDSKTFIRNFGFMWGWVVMLAAGKTVLPIAVVVAAIYYYRRRL